MYLWSFTSLCCENLFWHLSLHCGWKPMVLPFEWNLFSGTFTRLGPVSRWGKGEIHVIGCKKSQRGNGKGKRAAELGASLWCWQWYHALIGQISQMISFISKCKHGQRFLAFFCVENASRGSKIMLKNGGENNTRTFLETFKKLSKLKGCWKYLKLSTP